MVNRNLVIVGVVLLIFGLFFSITSTIFSLTSLGDSTTVNIAELTTTTYRERFRLSEQLFYNKVPELDANGCKDVVIKHTYTFYDDIVYSRVNNLIQVHSLVNEGATIYGTFGQSYSWEVDNKQTVESTSFYGSEPGSIDAFYGRNFAITFDLLGNVGITEPVFTPQPADVLVRAYYWCNDYNKPISFENMEVLEFVFEEVPECTQDMCVGNEWLNCDENTGKIISQKQELGKCGIGCFSDSDCGSGFVCQSNTCEQDCILNQQRKCFNGNVYYYDSCGNRGVLFDTCTESETCELGSCKTIEQPEQQCIQEGELLCIGNDLWEINSCGEKVKLEEACTEDCKNSACVISGVENCDLSGSGVQTTPCTGAKWQDYPVCAWDESQCTQPQEPVQDPVDPCTNPQTDQEVINCLEDDLNTDDGLSKQLSQGQIIRIIIGAVVSLIGLTLILVGSMK